MKQHLLLAICLFSGILAVRAQGSSDANAEYTKVITARSEKIVDGLGISDSAKRLAVTNVLVTQYRDLGLVHDWREAEKKRIKAAGLPKETAALQASQADTAAEISLEKYHRYFIGRLSAVLTPEQVNQVKDAMTYRVLEVTYKAYLEMLPSLTAAQKDTILSDLIEAREYSMDGGSSEEKHAWFGKYKGRINNFLSREGIDTKQAQKDWAARRAEAKKQ